MFKKKHKIPKEFRTPDININNESKNPFIILLFKYLKWRRNRKQNHREVK